MKLAMTINYSGDFHADVHAGPGPREGRPRRRVGRRGVLLRRDQPGRLPRRQDRAIEIGTGIINVFSRTATAIAQTAAGCDFVSDGRFILGLGASGPAGDRGLPRRAVREADAAHPRLHRGLPDDRGAASRSSTTARPCRSRCPPGQGTGLGKPLKLINHPVRADIPIFWASLMGKQRRRHGQASPTAGCRSSSTRRSSSTCGATTSQPGSPSAIPTLGPLQISAGGMVAIGDEYAGDGADRVLDLARPSTALYVGGMGARGQELLQHDLPRSTATSTRPPRSRTSTCRAARRRRPPPCRASCSPTPTSSARVATSPSASPPTRRPA